MDHELRAFVFNQLEDRTGIAVNVLVANEGDSEIGRRFPWRWRRWRRRRIHRQRKTRGFAPTARGAGYREGVGADRSRRGGGEGEGGSAGRETRGRGKRCYDF